MTSAPPGYFDGDVGTVGKQPAKVVEYQHEPEMICDAFYWYKNHTACCFTFG